eukprot:TRINITY_DN16178_c0_g1_i1.p1 TRINITY_DN16178_c0_g1~~TRINITY_DN16178_c0_g1_i1.p1  ORF type:complete len:270 (+),score=20.57 TRINITY_DN16178_c0_g1_i1:227-1036(+)
MPIIEGVGDEVVWAAILVASVVFYCRNSTCHYALNVFSQAMNAVIRVFHMLRNSFCSNGIGARTNLSRVSSEGSGQLRGRMDSPPENDCCSICHDEFNVPCQANCSHWFCGQCILRVWDHSSALQPCRCPICRRPITLLIPSESGMLHQHDLDADSILQRIRRYNRMFGEGSVGLVQRLQDMPLLLRRLLRELMDPQRALPLVIRARVMISLALSAVYVFSPLDILPEGILGIVGLLDDVLVVLLVFFYIATIYRSALFYRYGGPSISR